jgi:hypothetical protein
VKKSKIFDKESFSTVGTKKIFTLGKEQKKRIEFGFLVALVLMFVLGNSASINV